LSAEAPSRIQPSALEQLAGLKTTPEELQRNFSPDRKSNSTVTTTCPNLLCVDPILIGHSLQNAHDVLENVAGTFKSLREYRHGVDANSSFCIEICSLAEE
jgi:hypothetical protein